MTIVPSPAEDVVLIPYQESLFPKFKQLFEPSLSTPLRFLTADPAEVDTALVLYNLSEKAITALCYRWITVDSTGKERPHTVASDSYMVSVYRPILKPLERQLITPSKVVNESMIDHVASGGGLVRGGSGGRRIAYDLTQLAFQIDFILFEDGEICGPDPDHYAMLLIFRKPGAEYVAKQIRLAQSESRDVTPVLSALAEIPHLGSLHHAQGDRLVQWTQYYARHYLHSMQADISKHPGFDRLEIGLRHLDNLPEVPKFHRRHKKSEAD